MRRTWTVGVLVAVAACAEGERPGTQIGFEEQLVCDRISSEVVVAGEVPDGFGLSVADAVGIHLGDFAGVRWVPDLEVPTDEPATLGLVSSGGGYVLERYLPVGVDRDLCPDRLLHDVVLTLDGSPLIRFEGDQQLVVEDDGRSAVRWEGDPAAFEQIPPPTGFDPATEGVRAKLSAFGGADSVDWSVEVAWGRPADTRRGTVGHPALLHS